MTKITYVDALNFAIDTIQASASFREDDEEIVEKLEALKGTLEKRKSAPSKKRIEEMNGRVEAVYEALLANDEPVTVTELMKGATNEVATYSNQRVSALLSKLVKDGRAIKTVEKRKAFYAIAE